MEFLFLLGRFHVVLLHIPLGVIVALCVLELLSRREKYRYLASASTYLWIFGAVSALVTVAFGYLHFAEGSFDSASGHQHRLFGTILAVVFTAAAVLRASKLADRFAAWCAAARSLAGRARATATTRGEPPSGRSVSRCRRPDIPVALLEMPQRR